MMDNSRTNDEESRLRTDRVEPIVIEPPLSETPGSEAARESGKEMGSAARSATDESLAPLFSSKESARMRLRWESIQAGFVDEPRHSVQMADEIVSEAIKHLNEGFAVARNGLEQQWDHGDGVSTEDLRLSLRRYKAFFERLLSI